MIFWFRKAAHPHVSQIGYYYNTIVINLVDIRLKIEWYGRGQEKEYWERCSNQILIKKLLKRTNELIDRETEKGAKS